MEMQAVSGTALDVFARQLRLSGIDVERIWIAPHLSEVADVVRTSWGFRHFYSEVFLWRFGDGREFGVKLQPIVKGTKLDFVSMLQELRGHIERTALTATTA